MKNITKSVEKSVYFIFGIALIFILWAFASYTSGSSVIVPSIREVFVALVSILQTKDFYTHFAFSLLRVFITFSIAIVLSTAIGIVSAIFRQLNFFLMPLISVIRTIPLLPLILLAIVWFTPNYVPIFVSLLMIFPIIYNSIITAIDEIDINLIEMAQSYTVSKMLQIRKLYIPSIAPYFLSACSMSMGITWKSVLAAEIISLPKYSIGFLLYTSHQYLETANTFAYCIIALLLNALFEILIKVAKR